MHPDDTPSTSRAVQFDGTRGVGASMTELGADVAAAIFDSLEVADAT
jgi:hypothetical protein